MSEIPSCYFGNELEKECHKSDFCRSVGTVNLSTFSEEEAETLLWRAGLLNHTGEISICNHHKEVFGNVFERRNNKCCGILKNHSKGNVKGAKRVSLFMAKELKKLGYNVSPGFMLCRQCSKEYELLMSTEPEVETVDELESTVNVDATDDDFQQCVTPKRKANISLDTMDISPIVLHGVAQHSRVVCAKRKLDKAVDHLRSNLSGAYNVDIGELSVESSSVLDDEVKQKSMELDRLHDMMKEKLINATTHEQIQIITLSPDSWSRQFVSKFFQVSEYVVRTARELKKVSGILSKPGPKRGKSISEETLELVLQFYENDEFSRQMPGKKDSVSMGKGIHKQKRLILCNLKEMYAAFKEKHTNVKIGFSKFCELRPKWCVLAGSTGTHSVCVCSIHQNAHLLVNAIGWEFTYKDFMNKLVCDSAKKECMMHRCELCPGKDGLRAFLDEQLSDVDLDDEFHFNQWDTTDRASLTTHTCTYREYIDLLIDSIDQLTRHSYLAKGQAKYLRDKKESLPKNEALILGDFAENYQFLIQDEIQSYHWSKEYCTLHPVVIYYRGDNEQLEHISLCFISDDNSHDTPFIYHVQSLIVDHLRKLLPNINKLIYFSDGCGGQYKNYKNFMNLCLHKQDFGVDAEWIFFATSHGKSPCDGIGGTVKRHAAKRSLQRPLDNQILDYKAMIDVCKEMTSIQFFDISKETMEPVRKSLLERFSRGDTVPGTRSSHHFVPVSTSKIAHKLSSEDDSYIDTHDFNLPTIPGLSEITPSTYVTCIYDSFWWVGLVRKMDKEQGDAEIDFMHPHGPRNTFNWPARDDTCYVPFKNILCVLKTPTTSTGRTYKITDADYQNTVSAFDWAKHNEIKHI